MYTLILTSQDRAAFLLWFKSAFDDKLVDYPYNLYQVHAVVLDIQYHFRLHGRAPCHGPVCKLNWEYVYCHYVSYCNGS
jgi:hypothetical protein